MTRSVPQSAPAKRIILIANGDVFILSSILKAQKYAMNKGSEKQKPKNRNKK
jgi:hypothetical protein